MKRYKKDKWTMIYVAGLLVMAILSTVTADAGVSIPNTFTSGSTISSSQMNSNFDVINNALPVVGVNISENFVTLSSTAAVVISLTMTVPSSGFVLVTYKGVSSISHTNGTRDMVRIELSSSASAITNNASFMVVQVPGASPTASDIYYNTLTSQRLFPVSGAGSYTFYANADLLGGTNASVGYNYITGVFIPTASSTLPAGY